MRSKVIFLIGPGGVGKSTSGKILAKLLDFNFIDLDSEFMSRIGHIGNHIDNLGYQSYVKNNSALFFEILDKLNTNSVFVLSSGFLAYQEIDETLNNKHQRAIKDNGVSIRLLPHCNVKKAAKIVARRQVNRGFGLEYDSEYRKYVKRHSVYKSFGDIKIDSNESSQKIAELMKSQLEKWNNRS